jgi:glutathione S-transferase
VQCAALSPSRQCFRSRAKEILKSCKQIKLSEISILQFCWWTTPYYGIPYTHHLLLPGFHVFSVKPAVERPTTSASIKRSNARTSPHSTPCLVVYGDDLKDVQESLHESHDILRYLSDHFSTPERVNLYESCGAAQEDKVNALEKHYDEVLGRAARMYGYGDILVLNKWRALIPFALLGFTNRVGILQSVLWFILSPLLGPLLISVMKLTTETHEAAMQTCRDEFAHASQCKYKFYLAVHSPCFLLLHKMACVQILIF